MPQERKKEPTNDIDKGLDALDVAQDATEARITETLAIDGETHPQRNQVHKELQRLNVRKRGRKRK